MSRVNGMNREKLLELLNGGASYDITIANSTDPTGEPEKYRLPHFGVSGIVRKSHMKWTGKWWKPWAWKKITMIDEIDVRSIEVVSNRDEK